ncbi:MAG: Hsp20/alpha crystallin family protein [Hyphomicrobiales bacterium]|nr:Hsp20/alpha crystallin family protein [Hyphomicrobiales bacterium]
MIESPHSAGFWPEIFEPFRAMGSKIADWFTPISEASSDDDIYKVVVELPGVKADDIDITLLNHILMIKGDKYSERKEEKEGSYFFSERQYGAFQRSFKLPMDASSDGIKADFKDGVLTVLIGREKTEVKNTQRITINTG